MCCTEHVFQLSRSLWLTCFCLSRWQLTLTLKEVSFSKRPKKTPLTEGPSYLCNWLFIRLVMRTLLSLVYIEKGGGIWLSTGVGSIVHMRAIGVCILYFDLLCKCCRRLFVLTLFTYICIRKVQLITRTVTLRPQLIASFLITIQIDMRVSESWWRVHSSQTTYLPIKLFCLFMYNFRAKQRKNWWTCLDRRRPLSFETIKRFTWPPKN